VAVKSTKEFTDEADLTARDASVQSVSYESVLARFKSQFLDQPVDLDFFAREGLPDWSLHRPLNKELVSGVLAFSSAVYISISFTFRIPSRVSNCSTYPV